MFRNCTVALLGLLVIIAAAGSTAAQSDPFGSMDVVSVVSAEASPGEEVEVRFNVKNDEALGSLSIPVVYDPNVLTLQSATFENTRVGYLGTTMITPSDQTEIDGHFLATAIQMFNEEPIAVGDGWVLIATFKVDDSAAIGTVSIIDTLFYPPGGELILVGPKRDDGTSSIIHPEFQSGQVTVVEPNRVPTFAALADQYVMEGDTLALTIAVNDPDKDDLTMAATAKPAGASFVDNGDGTATLNWIPEYVGPNSADGSPFTVGLWVSDGELSAEQTITVNVVNANRAPAITAPENVTVEAGKLLQFALSAFDPDFEDITWTAEQLPENASFTADNPGLFRWQSDVADTGSRALRFIAADLEGLADTVIVSAQINPVALYHLSIDSVEIMPGAMFDLNVNLDNKLPVSSFNLLFHYDPSIFVLHSISNEGTRSEAFEYFHVSTNDLGTVGNIRLVGIADNGGGTLALAAGEGSLALGRFQATTDITYAGMSMPVRFLFLDAPVNEDNTLGDSLSARIEQDNIVYTNGDMAISDIGEVMIGDINLNNLACEIGDVIYFTNFFVDPVLYSFNVLQYANSDVNQDDVAATVSDLVALINIVVNGEPAPGKVVDVGTAAEATVTAARSNDALTIGIESAIDLGAALVVIESEDDLEQVTVQPVQDRMDIDYRIDNGQIKVLVYSLTGETMAAGAADLVEITGIQDYDITTIDLGSVDGRPVLAALQAAGNIPTSYVLEQNYPNPFNPETTIQFALPQAGSVNLVVFNVLGQQVKQLVDRDLPAGHHSITWNGTDTQGQPVASGVYLYRLQAGPEVLTRKMMLLK